MIDSDRIAALIGQAGYGGRDPIVVGVRQGSTPPVFVGNGMTATTVAYTASISKQITAACAALLVRQGRLDTESTLATWMPELPAWAGAIRVRHLIHHTSGLPNVVTYDDLKREKRDRTSDAVIRALAGVDRPAAEPGTEFRYCNAGYVCLAVIVERAAGRPLPGFARERFFQPLGMAATQYWSGPAPHPPGAAPTEVGSPAALSLGDGGVWSTAADLMRWNEAIGGDELLHTPGHLDDGTALDYAWGVGIRSYAGHVVHRHGGLWAGLSAQLVRFVDPHASFVIIALDHDEDRTSGLADAIIKDVVGELD
ncbi:serine hydrolase domain-containing protein [Actinoplanes sp. CA-142083]|uniref:serine hydrolase domain-containing protein n=1 Tax=Actinoplanes sp. CA-142083 TaxID=3239903 RepID=UPI003D906D47